MTAIRAGLIGAGIGRSRFGAAMQLLSDAAGIPLDFTPIDTEDIPSFDLPSTLDRLQAEGWTGVSVTHPWKPAAAGWAGSGMAGEARALGAANLLRFTPELSGHNTDFTGFLKAWAHVLDRPPGRVAVAGAGGVARAIVPALSSLGASDIAVWDPRTGAAEALARDCGPPVRASVTAREDIRAADGLVNATPLGMAGHPGTAFAHSLISGQAWAFDAVYTPTDTAFLRAAADRGLAILTGFDLFRFMALESFALYAGVSADPASALPALAGLRPTERHESAQ